jgi:hypothetical protein
MCVIKITVGSTDGKELVQASDEHVKADRREHCEDCTSDEELHKPCNRLSLVEVSAASNAPTICKTKQ